MIFYAIFHSKKAKKLRKKRMPTERHESAEVGHGFIELNSMIPETWWIPWWIMENNYQNISKHAGNFMGYWWILGISWDINGKNGISSDIVTFDRFSEWPWRLDATYVECLETHHPTEEVCHHNSKKPVRHPNWSKSWRNITLNMFKINVMFIPQYISKIIQIWITW